MTGGIWPPSTWSVFDMMVRTNNTIEGSHNKWRQDAPHLQQTCYILSASLFQKAKTIPMTEVLVCDGKLNEAKSPSQVLKDLDLQDLWEEFKVRRRTTNPMLPTDLLERVKHVTRNHDQFVSFTPDAGFEYDSDESVVAPNELNQVDFP